MQVPSAAGDIPKEIITSGVVKQIEPLFFAVINLNIANALFYQQRDRHQRRGEHDRPKVRQA